MINKIKNNKCLYFLVLLLFISYILVLLNRVLFYAYGNYYRYASDVISYNIIPFKTIVRYFKGFNLYPLNVWFFNLFGNVLAFIPFGFFLPIVFKRVSNIKNIMLYGILFSLFIEILQLTTRLGSFDIDDIILNTIGTVLGFYIMKVIDFLYLNKN